MIGIVGGGFAGLAAAYRLQRAGREVTVFEAADDIGGLAATYETAGDPIERFYHHLSTTEETIVELAEALGLGGAIEWQYKSDAFYVDGVIHPMDTLWEIAAYPYLSVYDKFRLGMLTLGIDVRGGRPSFETYDDFTDFEDVAVEEFLIEHTTRTVYEQFWRPLLEAKFGSRTDDVSAAWLLGRIQFRGDRDLLRGEQLGYVNGSFSRVAEGLAAAVGRDTIRTGARVTDIEMAENTVASLTVTDDGMTETHDVDAVVIATMPHILTELTGYECAIDFQGTVCAVVSIPEPLTDTYWLNFIDEAPFGVLIEHTNFVPPDRYGGEHLLYLASYIQKPSEPVWRHDDEGVRQLWLDGLAEMFQSFDPAERHWMKVARNPRTAPIYERGYLDKVVPYHLGTEVADGVYYAGMASRAQYPERSLNGAIEAGFAAADSLLGGNDS